MSLTEQEPEQTDAEETRGATEETTEQAEASSAPEQDESDSVADIELPNFRIRRAVLTDVLAIYRLLKRMHAESNGFVLDVDEHKAMATILALIETRWVLIATSEDGRRLVGTMAVAIDTPWYSKRVSLIDMWWYVAPEYRPSGTAAALAERMIEETANYRSEHDARLTISNFATGNEHVRHVDVFVAGLGFTRVGGLYVYEG